MPQFAKNDLQVITFLGIFLNLAVFMPIAVLSQRLMDISISVREGAFYAAFAVEGGDILWRRRVVVLMEVLAARPAKLSLRGFGPLNHGSALSALRSWYSFTSFIMKVAG